MNISLTTRSQYSFKLTPTNGLMLSKASFIKKDCYTCQCLDTVDMHIMYAKLDQNIQCGSRVMNIFINC